MPHWLRVWLVGFAVYFLVHWLSVAVFGLNTTRRSRSRFAFSTASASPSAASARWD